MKRIYYLLSVFITLIIIAQDTANAQIQATPDNYFVPNTPTGARRVFDVIKNDTPGACASTPEYIQLEIVSGKEPKIGAARVSNGKIDYAITKDKYGQDSLTYRITCPADGSSSTATVYINIVGKTPDFINEAECTVDALPFVWDIERKAVSRDSVMYLTSPLVGDLDGDGIPEIVAFNHLMTGASDGVIVFNNDLTRKHLFYLKTTDESTIVRVDNNFGHPFALGDVDNDGKGEILVSTGSADGYKLRCYTEDGTQKWASNDGQGNEISIFKSSGGAGPAPIIADIDGDGAVEIFAGDRLFDGTTGRLLTSLPDGNGPAGRPAGRGYYSNGGAFMPVFADIDNDGIMELVGGNTTYKVVINRDNPALSSITFLAQVDQIDGFASIADIDCDGILDIVITSCEGATPGTTGIYTTMYAWQGNTGDMIGSVLRPVAWNGVGRGSRISRAFVGDINNDGRPEICFTYARMMAAYAYDHNTKDFVSLWTDKTTSDTSGATTMTMFDFNLDGEVELVYRDETHIRILDKNGDNVKDKDGVDAIFECKSATHTEYPVVADLDGDGHAEIIVSGILPEETGNNKVRLQVFGSKTPKMWAPARKVWNQHGYNPLYVNNDLTIPAHPMPQAAVVAHKDGTLHRPYNNYLQQAGELNTEGENLNLAPDLEFELGKNQKIFHNTNTDDLEVTAYIANSGDMDFSGDILLSLYAYKRSTSEYILIGTETFTDETISKSGTETFIIKIPNYTSIEASLPDPSDFIWYVALNLIDDAPNAPNGFFNDQRECNSWNNLTSRISYVSGYVILCKDETAILNIEPANAFDCYWYKSDYSEYKGVDGTDATNIGDSKMVKKLTENYREYYLIDVYQKGTNNKITAAPDTVFIYQAPDSLIWTGKLSADWNNIQNWMNPNDPDKSEIFSYVPRGCTNVLIPSTDENGVQIARYPNLTQGVSNYGNNAIYSDVRCNNITLEHGGEVLRSDLLIYSKAYVQLNLFSNRWYCFAPPLRNFYSGDIYMTEANPYDDGMFAYTRLFSRTNLEGMYVEGSWGRTFSLPNQTFAPGDGFGVWIDDWDPDASNHQNMSFKFPKMDDQYWRYNDDGSIESGPHPLQRDYAHRFIYEQTINSSTKDVTLSVEATSVGKEIIMGNPFMAQLDFDKFYEENKEYIENYYRLIDSNGQYATYYISGGVSTGNPVLTTAIAPMQAVLLTAKKTFSANTLVANPSMTFSQPGSKLRSEEENIKNNNFLRISISDTEVRNRTALIFDSNLNVGTSYSPQSDIFKILKKGEKTYPSVYFITDEGYYMDIKQLSSFEGKSIRLGISGDVNGPMALAFENLPKFLQNTGIYLEDKEENTITELKSTPLFIYTFNKTTEDTFLDDRFVLRFERSNTGIDLTDDKSGKGSIRFKTTNNCLEVFSIDDSLLEQVLIYDLQGRIIEGSQYSSKQVVFTLTPGIYIIKAWSNKSNMTFKCIINN